MPKMRMCDVLVNLKNWDFDVFPKYPLTADEAEVVRKALSQYKGNVAYRVERSALDTPDDFYKWGTYDNRAKAESAMKELLECSGVADVRIVEVEEDD